MRRFAVYGKENRKYGPESRDMPEASADKAAVDSPRKLSDVMREVKNAAADRGDVVVEMREASRMRLELLAQELEPFFAEVPRDIEWFDFAISSGSQPRLWIDAVSHVGLGRDRRTYRFVTDTRLGRTVLAESTDLNLVAEQVKRYVAERLIEHQKAMAGEAKAVLPHAESPMPRKRRSGWRAFLRGLLLFVAGAIVGLACAVALFWDRLAALGLTY
jgi:hypothetical protein